MLKQSRNWFETFKSNQLLQLTNPSKASTKCSPLPIAYQLSQNTVSHFVIADLSKLCIWSVQNVPEFCHQIHLAQITCRKLVGENPNHNSAQGDLSGHSSCKLNMRYWHSWWAAIQKHEKPDVCLPKDGPVLVAGRRCWAQEARSLLWHHLSGPVVTCS